jgi:hypothetical protein
LWRDFPHCVLSIGYLECSVGHAALSILFEEKEMLAHASERKLLGEI